MSGPSWGIVATVDEPVQLLQAWVAWHLSQGARELHLYLDRPDPVAEAALADLPGVRLTVCDDAYWAGKDKPREVMTMRRQLVNANDALAHSDVDWLLHCDADEFVRDGAAMGTELAGLPETMAAAKFTVEERVRRAGAPNDGLFDGVFRRIAWNFDSWEEPVYGRWTKFLRTNMSGHTKGKSLIRRGGGVRIGLHLATMPDGQEAPRHLLSTPLLHFDGLTPNAFLLKLAGRISLPYYNTKKNPDGPIRERQVRFLRNNAGHPRRLAEFAAGVLAVTDAQVATLAARNAIDETPFDPTAALAALGLEVDLSVKGFDAALMARGGAELAASVGLVLDIPEGSA